MKEVLVEFGFWKWPAFNSPATSLVIAFVYLQ
jgi:hypothetical protein